MKLFPLIILLTAVTAFAQSNVESYIDNGAQKSQMYDSSEIEARARNFIKSEFYGGTDSDTVVESYENDADVHLGSNFDGCQNLTVITNGCKILDLHLYWWPVTTVSTGNFSETKHATKDLYEKYNPDYEKKSSDGYYGKALDIAVEGIKRGSRLADGSEVSVNKYDPHVENLDSSSRFFNGSAGGMTIAEYHLTPTLAQMAWAYSSSNGDYEDYSSELAEDSAQDLRMDEMEIFEDICHFPLVPKERFSDIVPMIEPARDVGWSVANFDESMEDLENKPALCTDKNIDQDVSPQFLDSLVDALGGGGSSFGSGGSFMDQACVPGYGRARPVTIYGHDVMTEPAVAAITAIKAINTASKIEGFLGSMDFAPIDKLQWVEPVSIQGMCVPQFLIPFLASPSMLGLTTMTKNQNPGMTTVTHWKFFACCTKSAS